MCEYSPSLGGGGSFARSDQGAQAAIDVIAPCLITNVIAFVIGHQPLMSKANFSLRILFSDLENYSCVFPFAFVFRKLKIIVHDEPDHFLCRDQLNDPDLAAMDVLVVVIEFALLFVRAPLDIFGPPPADIIDSDKCFLWRLVYQDDGCEILIPGADRRNELLQTIGYIAGPGIGAGIETFISWSQTLMCETDLRFALLFSNVENHLCAGPFVFVLHEIDRAFRHKPDHFFVWNKLY